LEEDHCFFKGVSMGLSVPKHTILVLCTGNSARSQMAEALINHFLGDQWQAFSAGTQPAGYVHPMALQVLEEIGIQHQGVSKPADAFRGKDFDVVLTVCDDAAENCPAWLGEGKRVHIGFPDPAKAEGSQEEKLAAFRQARDDIRSRIVSYLQALPANFP
jgi:arsenate reductase (thioredoxin)